MFDIIKYRPTKGGWCAATQELLQFMQEQWEAIFNAAELLGGRTGTNLAQAALDGLQNGSTPSLRSLRLVDELLQLFTLEHVHDLEREEAARFAAIDPLDPRVEEICLLADGLRVVLDDYRCWFTDSTASKEGRVAA